MSHPLCWQENYVITPLRLLPDWQPSWPAILPDWQPFLVQTLAWRRPKLFSGWARKLVRSGKGESKQCNKLETGLWGQTVTQEPGDV